MASVDFVIAGAGIIGLSLALELEQRGASVIVLERNTALRQTSFAAAGMLAVEDRMNPAALYPLAALSASLYAGYLDRIARLGGMRVPFQTTATLDAGEDDGLLEHTERSQVSQELVPELVAGGLDFHLIEERSVDPRQLGAALLAAVRASTIELREQSAMERLTTTAASVRVTTGGEEIEASHVIDCMGTWSPAPVAPRKGQMLAVKMPPSLDMGCVVRTSEVYLVPRTAGPDAGRVVIGATIEDAGYDLTVHPQAILELNRKAIALLPALAGAEFIESWSGLRPATSDGLPILGAAPGQPRYVLATGHFRNGILLAPATAHVMAQLLFGEPTTVALAAFAPSRF